MNNSQGKKKSTFIASETILAAAYFDFWAGGVNYRISKANFLNELAADGVPSSPTQTVGIVAHPGGGQADAVELTTTYNIVETVGTDDDSVKLPLGAPGTLRVVKNNVSSKQIRVYPGSGGMIDAGAVDSPYVMYGTDGASFYCYAVNKWAVIGRALF